MFATQQRNSFNKLQFNLHQMTFQKDFIDVIKEFQKLPLVSLRNVRALMEKKEKLRQENEQIADAIIASLTKSDLLFDKIKDTELFIRVQHESKKLDDVVKCILEKRKAEESKQDDSCEIKMI